MKTILLLVAVLSVNVWAQDGTIPPADIVGSINESAKAAQKAHRQAIENQRTRQETKLLKQQTEQLKLQNEMLRQQLAAAKKEAENKKSEDAKKVPATPGPSTAK